LDCHLASGIPGVPSTLGFTLECKMESGGHQRRQDYFIETAGYRFDF
jgi:hypothetical protein